MTESERAAGSEEAMTEEQQPVIRDRRRVDPETGERRKAPDADGPATDDVAGGADESAATSDETAATSDELARARTDAAERLDDLRRLQAEYVNYRRRVERDREVVRENAKAEVLAEFLGVLDDIGRAREHGDLTGGFRSVGEALESVTAKAGLVRYGEPGDAFDPTIHEALMHGYADDVEVATCTQILQPGYRVGERILRAARVAVSEPTEALPEPGGSSTEPDETTAGATAENGDQEH